MVQAAPTTDGASSSNDLTAFKAQVQANEEDLKKKVEEANSSVAKMKESI